MNQLRTSAANLRLLASHYHANAVHADLHEGVAWNEAAEELERIAEEMEINADALEGVRRLPLVMTGG